MVEIVAAPAREVTPQRIHPRHGRCYGRARRARRIRAQADALGAAHRAAVASSTPLPRASLALAYAELELGKEYRITGCRCEPGCPCEDCSGLVCLGANEAGAPHLCTTSFALAIAARELGLIIPFNEAIWTPGSILIRGPHNGEGPANGPSGSNGHVVYCKGDGASTVEAMGTAFGIVRGSVFGRGFDDPQIGRAAHYPGLGYGPLITRELDMFVQQHHYSPPRSVEDPAAVVYVSDDGLAIECDHSASIDGDQPVDARKPLGRRRWTAPTNPLGPGVTFIGVAYRPADKLDGRDGGVARCSDGSIRRFHLS